MRKLFIFTYFLVGALTNLWADNIAPTALTYSVEATPYATEFGNNFAYYHVNLDLDDFIRVAKEGNIKVSVEFEKGLEINETHFEKKPNGAMYYVTDFSTPIYKATVKDLSGNILLENTYGGFDKTFDFGKDRSYSESDLADKWLNEKDQYLQVLEFQQLDFTDLEVDLTDVLEETPIVVPVRTKAQPKRPKKEQLPTTDKETSMQKEDGETMKKEEMIDKEDKEAMKKEAEETMDKGKDESMEKAETIERENIPINEEAAEAEESILKDPFGELKEPLADESLRQDGKSAPPAPIDHEEKADIKNKAEVVENNRREETVTESITPVLSDHRNLVKLNLPNLAFGNLTLNYERLLSARNSVALNVGVIPSQSFSSALTNFVDAEASVPSTFSGLTATVEYRFYSKKRSAGSGFYYAPYARYAQHNVGFQSDIDDNLANVDARLSTVGLGGQIGIQWLIKDRVVIDWGILGLAAQWYNFESTFTAAAGDINFEEIRAELEMEIDGSILSNSLEFTNDENSLQARMPFLFGGARTYLAIGYKF